jgi:hypothetical protein
VSSGLVAFEGVEVRAVEADAVLADVVVVVVLATQDDDDDDDDAAAAVIALNELVVSWMAVFRHLARRLLNQI